MASIFDLTPAQLKELMASKSGPVLPPEAQLGRQPAGLLQADPVAVQEQSRINPNMRTGGADFYTNTEGQTGRSVPKGSGTSGIYEAAADAAEGGAKRGLLGRVAGGIFGPVGIGVQAALTPGELGNGELTPEQQQMMARQAVQNMGPDQAVQSIQYAKDLSDRTVAAGLNRKEPISLMDPNAVATEVTNQEVIQQDEQPPIQDTPVGPVPEANPTTIPQAAAKTAQDQEIQRQQLEAGALNGLSTGAVSRPQMAEAIVQADAQRAGKELNPAQTKAAVTQELTAMKGMDNKDLSRYVSYALMAAGVLAAVLDKSGRAGDAFSNSFNRQLDRNLQAGLMNQKQQQAANKLAMEDSWKQRQFSQTDTKLNQGQQTIDQTGKYRAGQLALGADRIAATREGTAAATKLGYYRLGQQASQFATTADLKRQGLLQRQANADRQYELQVGAAKRDEQRVTQGATSLANSIRKTNSQIELNNKKLNSQGGVTLTSKDAEKIVKEFEDNQNVNLGGNRATVTAAVMNAAKNDPQFKNDPAGSITKILTGGGYVQDGTSFNLFSPNSPKIKQKKQ